MAKLTLADLKKLREAKHAEMNPRDTAHKDVQIIVGMGTCGIAAEAKRTFDEPTVEVAVPGMPTVVYGKGDADTARKIVNQHVVRKLLVNDHVFDKPAADIVRK